jgi:coenzyme F420-reducing hydrogenase delta subunit/ferredoxin
MYEPKIIGFLCTWCSYTGADLAGTSRLKTPWNLRAIRIPCSGRVSPELIIRAFDKGADGVIVLGCHIGECHYDSGNHRTAKRIPILKKLLSTAGLDPERLHLDWVSASEAERYSKIITEFSQKLRNLGPNKWNLNHEPLPLDIKEGVEINKELTEIGADWADKEKTLKIQSEVRANAKQLLKSGSVSCVIGYEVGSRGYTRPAFIYETDEVDSLVWNKACTHNLTTYLIDKRNPNNHHQEQNERVAIVLKPCDSKSINVLIAENHLKRDQIHILGVTCDGIDKRAPSSKSEGTNQSRCISCELKTPILFDTLIGDPEEVEKKPAKKIQLSQQINKLTSEQRLEFWLHQFDRCIRCYACRQVCPICSCPTCLYEKDDSLWVGSNIQAKQIRTFHLGRAFHLAGRCVGCNECERACPMNIPISILNQSIADTIEETFNFKAGLEPIPSPITTMLEKQVG